ncbi:hypothetical protein BUB20358_06137 [Burkholderia ubonensis]|nr:hypothetical protein BUB20358_06137 [Burkholderia ubonensis]
MVLRPVASERRAVQRSARAAAACAAARAGAGACAERDRAASRDAAHAFRGAGRQAGAAHRGRSHGAVRDQRSAGAAGGRARGGGAGDRGGRGGAAVRSGRGAAAARAAGAAGRRGSRDFADATSHRVGRVVDAGAVPGAWGAVHGVRRGPGVAAAAAGNPVLGLRGVAAGVAAGRHAGVAARLLARPAGRCAGGADAAVGSPAAGGAELPRRAAAVHDRRGVDVGAARARAGRGRHAVHGAARRLCRAAGAAQRPARRRGRHADREPHPRRAGGPDRLLREHAGAAHADRCECIVSHAAGGRAGNDAGRLCAPGPAVRAPRRGTAAGAQPRVQPAVPGAVRVADRRRIEGRGRSRHGAARRSGGAAQRDGALRSVARDLGRRRGARRGVRVQPRSVRRRNHRPHGRAIPDPARRDRPAARPAGPAAAAAVRGRAACAASRLERPAPSVRARSAGDRTDRAARRGVPRPSRARRARRPAQLPGADAARARRRRRARRARHRRGRPGRRLPAAVRGVRGRVPRRAAGRRRVCAAGPRAAVPASRAHRNRSVAADRARRSARRA